MPRQVMARANQVSRLYKTAWHDGEERWVGELMVHQQHHQALLAFADRLRAQGIPTRVIKKPEANTVPARSVMLMPEYFQWRDTETHCRLYDELVNFEIEYNGY